MTAARRDWLLTARPFLVFVPILGGLLAVVVGRGRAAVAPGLLVTATGLLAWTLVEWAVHRAMHWRTRSAVVSRFQQQAHLRHHAAPHDLPHSVLRLSGSIPLAGVFFTAALLGFRDLERAMLFQAGLLAGYLWYESVHLLSHSHRHPPGLGALCRYHLRHHFETPTRTYGVTSPLWDWLFSTLPTRKLQGFVNS
jgi:sterol desaturase/sphingolipid hydroxylase (fatty acid hydroxylase superfamily)